MSYRNKILGCFLFSFSSALSFSQEALTDLGINPAVLKKYQSIIPHPSSLKHQPSASLSLPFIDDFSKESIYPDSSLWLDSNVFINRDYPLAPPTMGAATFDGVSKSGLPYDTLLISSTASEPADTLTSRPINLAPPAANIFLSFFWQAQGKGNDPEYSDSLLLDFFNPTAQQWKNVWYLNGYDPAPPDTGFHLEMLPITDTAYLKNDFQFRFRNYATVNGNVDHWHIDYVYLDQNRTAADTIFSDVAFVYNSPSLLKNYYAMPWNQYNSSEMKSSLNFFIRNNDTVQKNTSFYYTIYDNTGTPQYTSTLIADNVDSYLTSFYYNNPIITSPALSYSFPTLTDTASYIFEYILNTSPDKINLNDTLRFKQFFGNYYAYDDGTTEAGYGLNYYGGQIAYKFSLNTPDTLVAVQMLFNWIVDNVNQRQFKIRVWNDGGGIPGSMIYESPIVTPDYQYVYHPDWGNQTNCFTPYILSSGVPLSAGTFYVGWIQYTADLLNIGFDRNTNSNSKMFFNVGSNWQQSVLAGSWMIRPVLGDTSGLLVNEQEQETIACNLNIFPNPAKGKFEIRNLKFEIKEITIYNVLGEKVYAMAHVKWLMVRQKDGLSQSGANENTSTINPARTTVQSGGHQPLTIDLSSHPNGIYFIVVKDENGISYSQKIILAK